MMQSALRKFYLISFIMMLSSSFVLTKADIYSFETGGVPSDFKVEKGTLSINSDKGKLGSKSLQWAWSAGDKFSASPASMRTPSITSTGGITVWIYNDTPIDENLVLRFYEFESSGDDRSCSIDFNLNFKGWRCLWARFRPDMRHSGYTLRHMKWEAPKTGSGALLIDYLEFVDNVSWERISDMQYSLRNTSTQLEDFVAAYQNIPSNWQTTVTSEMQNSMNTIEQRVDEWFYGSGDFYAAPEMRSRRNSLTRFINNGVNRASQLELTRGDDGTVEGEGLFPMDFYNQTVNGVDVTTFRDINDRVLIQLAYDAIQNNSETSRNLIFDIYDWYYDQGFAPGSGLGRLRFEMLRSGGFYYAAYMMRNHFGPEQLERISDTAKWYTLYGKMFVTPENKGETADLIRALMLPKLFTILSLPDETERMSAMRTYVDYVDNALAISPGYLGTFKPDYSGYHHRGPYYNAYYTEALYIGSLIYSFLAGTEFELSENSYQNLKNGLKTYSFLCADYDIPGGIVGRFPTQIQNLNKILAAYSYLALSTNEPDPELTSIFKNMWKPDQAPMKDNVGRVATEITFKNTLGEVEKMLELAATSLTADPLPVGNKVMPYSGLFVARQDDRVLRVKGFSKYIWDFESSASENLYGRYLSYGHIDLATLNSDIRSYRPDHAQWDWAHIPGTTVKYLPKEQISTRLSPSDHRNFSDDPFLGGVVLDDNTAHFSNSMHDNTFDKNFYAKKSVFRFGELYYCVGSDIQSPNTNTPVHTTLFQNLKITSADKLLVNGEQTGTNAAGINKPVLQDNYSNSYIVLDGKVETNLSNSFITAWIGHGKAVKDGSYAYVIAPGKGEEISVQELNSAVESVEILHNNKHTHALFQPESNTLAVTVFDPASFVPVKKLVHSSLPSTIILQETEDIITLAFADPDMYRPTAANNDKLSDVAARTESLSSSIEIELTGYYEADSNNDIYVTTEHKANGNTIVRYDKLKDGQTYKVKLIKTLHQSVDNNKEQNFQFWRAGSTPHIYFIENINGENFAYKLYNSLGQFMSGTDEQASKYKINLSPYSSGLYFLRLNNNKNSIYKLTK